MQLDDIFNIPDNVDKQYLKDNISEDELLLLYWYIINNEDQFTDEQLDMLYDILYEIDDKLKELDEEQ
jgi:hypothetical protein